MRQWTKGGGVMNTISSTDFVTAKQRICFKKKGFFLKHKTIFAITLILFIMPFICSFAQGGKY